MSENPSRVAPQTRKANNEYTSLVKTLGRVARFFPSGQDRGGWPHAKAEIRRLTPWFAQEMEDLRGEPWTDRALANLLATKTTTLEKYSPNNWDKLSRPKQAEARLAWKILENDKPLSKEEFDAMWLGVSANLRGVKRSYRKKTRR